jgi:hypothetical protein
MLMRTRVDLVGKPGSGERIREVAELLLALRSHRDADSEIVLQAAPSWLVDAFTSERTMEEAEDWLAQWRAAPDKLAFERDSGWTASNWLHWFSSDNEFWSVGDVSVDDDGNRLTVYLEHDDDPIPFEALRWMALVGELQVGDESRID